MGFGHTKTGKPSDTLRKKTSSERRAAFARYAGRFLLLLADTNELSLNREEREKRALQALIVGDPKLAEEVLKELRGKRFWKSPIDVDCDERDAGMFALTHAACPLWPQDRFSPIRSPFGSSRSGRCLARFERSRRTLEERRSALAISALERNTTRRSDVKRKRLGAVLPSCERSTWL